MRNQNLQYYFLLILLVAISAVVFFIFKPFIYSIILAIIFAVIFEPLHRKILGIMPKYPSFAALGTAVLITIIFIIPLSFLGTQIVQEAQVIYHSLVGTDTQVSVLDSYKNNLDSIKENFPIFRDTSTDLRQYLENGLAWLIKNIGSIFSNLLKIATGLFIFIIALYYILRDGQNLKKSLVFLSPLPDTDDEMIFKKLGTAINSVVRGSLIVAVIQGILVAIGFTIFGVPGAALWGTVAAIASLIPGVGTALVNIPAVAFLFFNGETLPAAGLLLWALLAVGLIDNFLGPKLIGRGTNLHPLLILLSVLGGLALFGPVGFIIGPLSLSFLFALLDIYSYILKTKNT